MQLNANKKHIACSGNWGVHVSAEEDLKIFALSREFDLYFDQIWENDSEHKRF